MDSENNLEGLGKILIYQTEKGDTKIEVYFQNENIWMSQRNIAELFQVTAKTINEHIINIYRDKELEEVSTIRNFRIVQIEGLREIADALAFEEYIKFDEQRRMITSDLDELHNEVKKLKAFD